MASAPTTQHNTQCATWQDLDITTAEQSISPSDPPQRKKKKPQPKAKPTIAPKTRQSNPKLDDIEQAEAELNRTNQSINQSTNQSTDQSTDQSTSQSTNQSPKKPTKGTSSTNWVQCQGIWQKSTNEIHIHDDSGNESGDTNRPSADPPDIWEQTQQQWAAVRVPMCHHIGEREGQHTEAMLHGTTLQLPTNSMKLKAKGRKNPCTETANKHQHAQKRRRAVNEVSGVPSLGAANQRSEESAQRAKTSKATGTGHKKPCTGLLATDGTNASNDLPNTRASASKSSQPSHEHLHAHDMATHTKQQDIHHENQPTRRLRCKTKQPQNGLLTHPSDHG